MATDHVGTERDLWRLWEQRRLPVELATRDGQPLCILFPGVPNTGAGPDFLGAHIVLGRDPPVRGDVELHLKATSWEQHGHHRDARYDRVILHAVLFDDGGPAYTHSGTSIPLLVLGPLLSRDVPAADDRQSRGPCYDPNLCRRPLPNLVDVLHEAGRERFDARVLFWQAEHQARPLEDCIMQALLRCAGLGRNTDACVALADAIDGRTFDAIVAAMPAQAPAIAAAVLLGMAGLLDQAKADASVRETWGVYRDYWPGRPLESRRWQRFRVRPVNLPETRLKLIASIAARTGLNGFLESALSLFAGEPAAIALIQLLSTPEVPVGRAWALEAWTNVLLPCITAHARLAGLEGVAYYAARAYATLPGGGQNSVLQRMTGIAGLQTAPSRAIEQQGLLHLWASHCRLLQCSNCPLTPLS